VVGELIAGRYELEKLVGSGGMSHVFRAHDRLLERTVALQILHEQYTRGEDYVERFRREARAVAQLAHPNIVTVIDRGEQDGRQCIVFDYIEGGLEDEHCLRRNEAAFQRYRLVPRYLVDVSTRTQSATLFGRTYGSPFGIAPTGLVGLYRRGGDLMLAEAAAAANIPFVMFGGSNAALEAAARIAPDHTWYQLYGARDTTISEDQIRRARDAGRGALVLTVDVPVRSKRERNIRNGWSLAVKLKPSTVLEALTHPAWVAEYLRHGGVPAFENWAPYAGAGAGPAEIVSHYTSQFPAPAQTWRELEIYRRLWPRTLIVLPRASLGRNSFTIFVT